MSYKWECKLFCFILVTLLSEWLIHAARFYKSSHSSPIIIDGNLENGNSAVDETFLNKVILRLVSVFIHARYCQLSGAYYCLTLFFADWKKKLQYFEGRNESPYNNEHISPRFRYFSCSNCIQTVAYLTLSPFRE